MNPLRRASTFETEVYEEESDTEDFKAHRTILAAARDTDFDDLTSWQDFDEKFKAMDEGSRGTLLHRMARMKPDKFRKTNGPQLLKWLLKRDVDILCRKSSTDSNIYPLHVAIRNTNHEFLSCVLDGSFHIAPALELENNSSYNCL